MIVTLLFSAGALYGILRLQNYRWRLLASAYASDVPRPAKAIKRIATFVAVGGGAFYSFYAGVRVEVCADGLVLRMFPAFSAGAPPLFLPFAEMRVERTSWYLNSGSFRICMERGGGVELIIDEALRSWLDANSDVRIGQ